MSAESTAFSEERISPNFQWALQGRVVAMDNGATLASKRSFHSLMQMNTFAVITFDPGNQLASHDDLSTLDEFQLVANATLGDGDSVVMNACLDPDLSNTLTRPTEVATPATPLVPDTVLTRYPIKSVSLDSIEGLPVLDWLILDSRNDNLKILTHGERTLRDTLLIQVPLSFSDSHGRENHFFSIHDTLTRLGFRLYSFTNTNKKSNLPTDMPLEKEIATELKSTDGLYIPDDSRLDSMAADKLQKLTFVLHTVYQCHDLAYRILERICPAIASSYLMAEGYIWPIYEDEQTFTLTHDYCPEIWA